MLLQLQQVPAAGQSTEVTMEHHEQPGACVVREAVTPALGVGQGKRHCRPTDEIHRASPETSSLSQVEVAGSGFPAVFDHCSPYSDHARIGPSRYAVKKPTT